MNRQSFDATLLLTRRNLHGSALSGALFAIVFVVMWEVGDLTLVILLVIL